MQEKQTTIGTFYQKYKKLDESTAHRHLKSPQSLSGRSLHLTLVTKWPRSHMTFKIQILIQGHGQGQTHWSYLRPRVQINMFAFRFVAIGPVLVEIYKNSYFTLKIQGQGHSQGQIWWSHLRPRVQSMCLLFVLWQSDHFWQRYSQFHIWPWKFKVKVMSTQLALRRWPNVGPTSTLTLGQRRLTNVGPTWICQLAQRWPNGCTPTLAQRCANIGPTLAH